MKLVWVEAIVGCMMAGAALGQDCQGWVKRNPEHIPGNLVGFQAMAYDSSRRACVLVTGKPDPLDCVSETWLWDGDDWNLASDQYPCVEDGGAMSFDSFRNMVVHAGGDYGHDFGNSDQTFEWDGETWNFVPKPFGPERTLLAMAYDSLRRVTVMFGGEDDNRVHLDGTWEWDGKMWTNRFVPGPDGLAGHSMAYDSDRHVTVLHGGTTNNGVNPRTWEWDGETWALRSEIGPLKFGAGMIYDPVRHVCFLYGGKTGDQTGQESWEWDGEVWTKLNTPVKPPPVQGAPMAYDSDRHAVVLYTQWGETWEYLCEPPPCYPDLDGNGVLDLFDFLAFVNSFNAGDTGPSDCDHNGDLDLFDFLCYTNAFNAGC